MKNNIFQGVRLKNNNTEFCVYAPSATKMELCLFSDDEKQETRMEMQKDENGLWHLEIDGNLEGQKYGYRSHGEFNPEAKLFFNPNKLLVDPYAIELSRSLHNISNQEKEILLGDLINDYNAKLYARLEGDLYTEEQKKAILKYFELLFGGIKKEEGN